jgi:hypothetical protein
MKIKVFQIVSKEDKIYQELMEQYKTNPEIQSLLNESIIPSEMVLMGGSQINYGVEPRN